MKNLYYVVAIATFALLSCQQDQDPVVGNGVKSESYTFNASIENLGTRADMNADRDLVWASGDQIGIYFGHWTDDDNTKKHQAFSLSGGATTTNGVFTMDNKYSFNTTDATVAFFPWNGTGENNNNVYNGTMYFKLPQSYDDYTSGKMLTPLIASLSNTSVINFKHVGAAVKVTINNLPAGANKISMRVDGKQIYGNFNINPENAGTDALTLDEIEDESKNEIVLNYTNGSESAWTFIFPVPTLTTPKLSFEIKDINDITVWSKSPKAQSTLSRKDILEMPALTIEPYSKFEKSDDWTLIGKINGVENWGADGDIPMFTDGSICIAKGVEFKEGDKFKVRKGKDWTIAYPGTGMSEGDTWNVNSGNCGTKDVFFRISDHQIWLVESVCPYKK